MHLNVLETTTTGYSSRRSFSEGGWILEAKRMQGKGMQYGVNVESL